MQGIIRLHHSRLGKAATVGNIESYLQLSVTWQRPKDVWQRAAWIHGRRELVSWKSVKQKERKVKIKKKKNTEKSHPSTLVLYFWCRAKSGNLWDTFVALEHYDKAGKWEPGEGKESKVTKDEQREKRSKVAKSGKVIITIEKNMFKSTPRRF